MYNSELYHYGVKGMKWGVRKAKNKTNLTKTVQNNKRNNTPHETRKKPLSAKKAIRVGASVGAGLIGTSASYGAILSLVGSPTLAYMASPAIGTMLGMKYYDWINS